MHGGTAAFGTTEYATLSIAWANPYTEPPDGAPRVLWAVTVPRRAEAASFWAEGDTMTGHRPGDGYAHHWSPVSTKPRRTVSQAGKASIRQKRLRRKIERKAPLFAEQLIARELESDPEYYAARTNRRTA